MLIPRGPESLGILAERLRAGDVAIMACDTIYGFVGAVPGTEEKIRNIKGREETKPFLQLISGIEDLRPLGFPPPDDGFARLWPGPFTFVLKDSHGVTTAFRVPEDRMLRELVRTVGAPLYSTSVNRAGKPPMDDPAAMEEEFGSEVALVEDAGLFAGRQPSTVVNLSAGKPSILRQGAGIVPENLL